MTFQYVRFFVTYSAASVDGALDAVLARPSHRAFGFIALFHPTEPHFTEPFHACIGHFLKISLDHPLFDHWGTGVNFYPTRTKIVKRPLGCNC